MKLSLLLMFAALFVTSGCVSTSVVAVHDNREQATPIRRIMLLGISEDLERRNSWENTFATALSDYQAQCIRGIDVIPPIREYSNAEIYRMLADSSIEAVLAVALTDFWTEYYQSPDQYRTQTKITFSPLFNSASLSSTTRVTPGVSFKKHSARFDVRLLRFNADSSISTLWRANSTSRGNAFASSDLVVLSNATELCRQLLKDGFLTRQSNSKKLAQPKVVSVSKGMAGKLKFNNYGRLTVFGGVKWHQKLGYFNASRSEWLITEPLGNYGRSAKETIWDSLGQYAATDSDCSACNSNATFPPRIETDDGTVVGYLTLNPDYPMAIRDEVLLEWLQTTVCAHVQHPHNNAPKQ